MPLLDHKALDLVGRNLARGGFAHQALETAPEAETRLVELEERGVANRFLSETGHVDQHLVAIEPNRMLPEVQHGLQKAAAKGYHGKGEIV